MVGCTINNQKYLFKNNLTILQACEQIYIEVPKFCYNDRLSVAGNCRMCLVEVEKAPKPLVACATPLTDGMVILTDTPLVKKARESVLEFLLINHPLDCPICDQGGECDLQEQSKYFGSDRSRFIQTNKRSVQDKEIGPVVKMIMTRCIHCTRCVRFISEITGSSFLGVFGRGKFAEIGTYINFFLKTELSGNLVDLCPVGALTNKNMNFALRSWELKKRQYIDFLDCSNTNVVVFTKKVTTPLTKKEFSDFQKEKVVKILPYFNQNLSESWISDKSRFFFDGLVQNRLFDGFFIKNNSGFLVKTTKLEKCLDFFSNFFFENLFVFLYKKKNKNVNKYFWIYSENYKWNSEILQKSLKDILFYKALKKKHLDNQKDFISIITCNGIDLHSFYMFAFFSRLLGGAHFITGIKNVYLNNDFSFFFRNSGFPENIEKSDNIFLINTNPRKECVALNLKIKKKTNQNLIKIFSFNYKENLYYTYEQQGVTYKALLNFLECKSKISCFLTNAKNPLIIFGITLFKESFFNVFQNIFVFLNKKNILNTSKENFLIILHIELTNYFKSELNITEFPRSFIFNMYNVQNVNKTLLCYNFLPFKNSFFKNTKFIFGFFTHTLDFKKEFKHLDSFVALPIKSFIEQNAVSINMFGFLKSNDILLKAYLPNLFDMRVYVKMLLNSIFLRKNIGRLNFFFLFNQIKVLSANSVFFPEKKHTILKRKNNILRKKKTKLHLNKKLGKHYSISILNNEAFLNFYISNNERKMPYLFLNNIKNTLLKKKIFLSNFKKTINNFYQTEYLTENSSMMSLCSVFNQENFNFLN